MGPSPLGGRRDSALLLWPLASLLLPLLPLLVLLLSALEGQRRLVMVVPEGQLVLSAPFELQDGWLGSPRLELTAEIPPNSSIELDVSLLDGTGRTVLNLTKDGWRASGTWAEEGGERHLGGSRRGPGPGHASRAERPLPAGGAAAGSAR